MNDIFEKNSTLDRRSFLRLVLATGGAVALSPFLKACGTQPPPAPTATEMSLADLLAGLQDLDIDSFFQEAYRRWLVRDPESLTSIGLADYYGVGDANLTDISDRFIRETQALEAGTLEILRKYDRTAFSSSQALTADIYEWYLDDQVRGHPFLYDDYPINPIITSVHYNLYALFTIYHPLNNLEDANDYISRLSQVGGKILHLLDGLQKREERGVILPAFMIPLILPDIDALAQTSASSHEYYTAFSNRLTGVSEEDRSLLSAQVEEQVKETVVPAYQGLSDFLNGQRGRASNDIGVWQFEDGEAYYAQSLRRQTTSESGEDEIHELGKLHVERIKTEMQTLFSDLGYPSNESLPRLFERLANDSGTYSGQEAVQAYEDVIDGAKSFLPWAFDLLPSTDVIVIGGTEGDYYVPAPYDGSRPGIFYARTVGETPKYRIKSLAYHETIPGHHLQTAITQEIPNLPDLRRGMQFNAYTEGWALYAERLMWELGAYTGDPHGDLGRLRMEVFRAARLVVDTGIHAKRWDYDQAVNYMIDSAGFTQDEAQREITRYSVWPGQATSYYMGFLKILDLRQKAKDALGYKFDLLAFHRNVLENGSLPLSVLEQQVVRYIAGAAG